MQQHSSNTRIVLYINISYLRGKILIIILTCYDISYAHQKISDIVAFACKYANCFSVKLTEQLNFLLSINKNLTEEISNANRYYITTNDINHLDTILFTFR